MVRLVDQDLNITEKLHSGLKKVENKATNSQKIYKKSSCSQDGMG